MASKSPSRRRSRSPSPSIPSRTKKRTLKTTSLEPGEQPPIPPPSPARRTHVELSPGRYDELNTANSRLWERNIELEERFEALSRQNDDLAKECSRLKVQIRHATSQTENYMGLKRQCFQLVHEKNDLVEQLEDLNKERGRYQSEQQEFLSVINKELESDPEISRLFSDILHTSDLDKAIEGTIQRLCQLLRERTRSDEQSDKVDFRTDSLWENRKASKKP